MISNLQFLKMALDCIRFAKSRKYIEDYKIFSQTSIQPGISFADRLRTIERLVKEKFIWLDDQKMILGEVSDSDWLLTALAAGEPDAWEILGAYAKRKIKFDPDSTVRRQIGELGESVVMEWLKESLDPVFHEQIIHTSKTDDGAGFDIETPSVHNSENIRHLEVKAYSQPGSIFEFYLSRNELLQGKMDQDWRIVFVRIEEGIPVLKGYLTIDEVDPLLPTEIDPRVSWTNIRLRLEPDLFTPGLP